MSQLADQNTPVSQEGAAATTGHRAFSALAKVTLLALLGNALAYTAYTAFALLFSGDYVPAFFFGTVPALLAAGLVATRWRWTQALGAALVFITSTVFFLTPLVQYHLTHPGSNPAAFIAGVLSQACALIAVVAGIGATLQNERTSPPVISARASARPAPAFLRSLLMALSGVVVGMSLVALIVAANPQASSASSTTGEPTVHMGSVNFVQNVVLVPKGSKLLLVNDTTVEHILQNGSWTSSGTVVTLAEPGAPVLHNLDSKGGSLEIGPFNTSGLFHIYCTIHQGMNLTIVEQ